MRRPKRARSGASMDVSCPSSKFKTQCSSFMKNVTYLEKTRIGINENVRKWGKFIFLHELIQCCKNLLIKVRISLLLKQCEKICRKRKTKMQSVFMVFNQNYIRLGLLVKLRAACSFQVPIYRSVVYVYIR